MMPSRPILLALVALLAAPALAADNPGKARAQYAECRDLLAAERPCPALAACEAGLEAMVLAPLQRLADQARAACVSEQRARAAARRAAKRCADGRVSLGSTCCWPGQTLDPRGECAGPPTSCPPGRVLDVAARVCAEEPCPDGRVHVDERHCCWPEQVWYAERDRCLGIPSCPPGLRADGERCVPVIPDMDGDGLPDADDTCPTVAEDRDGFEDGDGCPEEDNDRDGICDALLASTGDVVGIACVGSDGCPLDPEDADGFEDGDGCPDPDNDGDGVLDLADACPLDPGPALHRGCRPPPDPTLRIVGWSTLGVGAALAAAGGVALLSTLDDREALDEPRVSVEQTDVVLSLTEVEAAELRDRVDRMETLGVTGLAAGGALLVAGVVLLIVDAHAPPDVQLEVAPAPDGQGAALGVSGRF